MKTTRWMMCLAAAALVLGCEQTTEPVAEADAVDLPAFKAEHVTLVREFVWDGAEGTAFVACANDGAGEDLYYDGIVVATTKKVYTPSGMYLRSTKIDDFIGLHHAQFQATGLTSGDVWIINPKGSTWTARGTVDQDGEFDSWHQTYSFKFTNQYGEKLHMQGNRIEKYDKNGDPVIVEYNLGSCPEIW